MIRTISYNDLMVLFRRKFAEYDAHMCDRALRDCYDAMLAVGESRDAMLAVGESRDPEYARKLWCEIDAIRDRQMLLKKKGAYV